MKKRTKIILLVLLVIFLTPKLEINTSYYTRYEVWQFGNVHYRESASHEFQTLSSRMYSYESLFFEAYYGWDHYRFGQDEFSENKSFMFILFPYGTHGLLWGKVSDGWCIRVLGLPCERPFGPVE